MLNYENEKEGIKLKHILVEIQEIMHLSRKNII